MPRAKKPKKPVESPRLPKRFDVQALALGFLRTHHQVSLLGEWTVENVLSARDQQQRGQFRQAVALWAKMLTDAAIYAAALNRLAPHRGLPRTICATDELRGSAESVRLEAVATFATRTSTSCPSGVLSGAFAKLAAHSVSVEQTYWEPRADGSRLDAFVTPFPLEAVEWSEHDQILIANTTEGRVPIQHGDGRWIVSADQAERPWQWGALVSLANVLASRPFAVGARSRNAKSHGDSKWLGELPQGVPLLDDKGAFSVEAEAFLSQLESLYEEQRAMIRPSGSKVERSEAASQNWQIFKEIIESDNRDAQRVLLGQDGTMTNSGGNYIKSWGLFGVRNDIVESDLSTVGSALSTGLLRVWSMANFGRWDRLEYRWEIPDADEDARRQSIADRRKAFWEEIASARNNGALVDQAYVDAIAKEYGVTPPKMADSAPAGGELYAYELEGGVYTINEFRSRKGFDPVDWGDVTKPERDAQLAQTAAPSSDGATASIRLHRKPLVPVVGS